jgi:hypothetical protein
MKAGAVGEATPYACRTCVPSLGTTERGDWRHSAHHGRQHANRLTTRPVPGEPTVGRCRKHRSAAARLSPLILGLCRRRSQDSQEDQRD